MYIPCYPSVTMLSVFIQGGPEIALKKGFAKSKW